MLGLRFGLYVGVLFWFLPLGMAAAFIGVQLAIFGFYMGATFAPNHMGMPIVQPDAKLDFLSKQVRTSRNITGGCWMSVLMGGLNYQVEHHLFPSMPRPHLRAARAIVREHCRDPGRPLHGDEPDPRLPIVLGPPEPRRPHGPRPVRLPRRGQHALRLSRLLSATGGILHLPGAGSRPSFVLAPRTLREPFDRLGTGSVEGPRRGWLRLVPRRAR